MKLRTCPPEEACHHGQSSSVSPSSLGNLEVIEKEQRSLDKTVLPWILMKRSGLPKVCKTNR